MTYKHPRLSIQVHLSALWFLSPNMQMFILTKMGAISRSFLSALLAGDVRGEDLEEKLNITEVVGAFWIQMDFQACRKA